MLDFHSMQKEKSVKQSYLQDNNYQIQTLNNALKVLEDKIQKAQEDLSGVIIKT